MRMRGVGAGGRRRVEDRSGADCATATAGLTSFRCPKAALFLSLVTSGSSKPKF